MATTSQTARAAGTAQPTWPGIITGLLSGRDLDRAGAFWAMDRVVRGEATAAQVSGFVIALRAKGETPQEIAALAQALRDHATPVVIPGPIVDLVGTVETAPARSTSPPSLPSSWQPPVSPW